MKNLNLSNVTETGSIPAGGYICKIIDAQDVPGKEYLMLKVDIAKGPYADYYKRLEEHFEEHPEEYEGIAKLKAFTRAVENEQSKRRNNRLQRIAEFKKRYEERL